MAVYADVNCIFRKFRVDSYRQKYQTAVLAKLEFRIKNLKCWHAKTILFIFSSISAYNKYIKLEVARNNCKTSSNLVPVLCVKFRFQLNWHLLER